MDGFDAFLRALLKAIFGNYPFDEEKSKKSFEIIKNAQTLNKGTGENDG